MMKQVLAVVLALAVAIVAVPSAWADSVHIGNTTTNQGGQGGQGGTGIGVGIGIGKGGDGGNAAVIGSGNSSNVNVTDVDVKNAVKVDNKDTNVNLNGQQQQMEQQANNTGNHQDVNIDVPRQAPPAVAPGLNVSSLSCYGTWGVGGSSPFGGVSVGFPTLEKGCDYSRTAMVLQNLGEPLAALIFYANPELGVRGALEKAGRLPKAMVKAVDTTGPDLAILTPTRPGDEKPQVGQRISRIETQGP